MNVSNSMERYLVKRRLKKLLEISEELNKKEYSHTTKVKEYSREYNKLVDQLDKAIDEEARCLICLVDSIKKGEKE